MIVAVASLTCYFAVHATRPLSLSDVVTMSCCLVGAGIFLSVPITHFLATPMIIGWAGTWDKEVWVRFPNRDYVALFDEGIKR
jgi:hypothetical protein